MKKFLLSLFVSLVGLVGFGNCANVVTPTYTFTGTYATDIANGSTITRFTWSVPIYQSVNFDTSDLYVYIDKFSVNGNDLSFSNSNGLYFYRLYPIVVSNTYFGGNFTAYQSAYFTKTSFNLSSNSNTKTYYNLIGLTFALKNSSSSAFDCSTNSCEIVIQVHFQLNDAYYVGGIYNPLTNTLNQCQFDLSECQGSTCISESTYNACVSDLSSCNSLLSGYSNSLDSCSNSYNSCSSSLNACLQANCPDVDIPVNTFSNVYVYSDNNYFPLTGTSNIYVNLPSFLGYTYNYTNNGSDLDIDVENNGDEEYIQSIMDINSYRPTSQDFTDIFVSGLTLVMPYIVVVLFIVFIWKLIKKIFK